MILPKEVELGVVPQNRTMSRGTAGASHVFRELYAAVNITFFKILFYFLYWSGSLYAFGTIFHKDKFGPRDL
jgi:hypothetical protein